MANQGSARSTAISLVAHAAVIVALLLLAPAPAPRPPAPPLAAAIEIALVDPPPSAPTPTVHAAGGDNTPAAAAKAQPLGLHGAAARSSIVRAPRRADPYADLAITYDGPASPEANGPGAPEGDDEGSGIGGLGHGLGLGIGAGGDGNGGLEVPEPPRVSLARDPLPKYDYSERWVRGSKQYRGKELVVDLRIDKHGRVHGAHLVKSIEPRFDLRVIALALDFEFEPARDGNGEPMEGTYRWRFRVHLM